MWTFCAGVSRILKTFGAETYLVHSMRVGKMAIVAIVAVVIVAHVAQITINIPTVRTYWTCYLSRAVP